jgi:hypothetical protein
MQSGENFMNVTKRDGIFLAIVVVVLGALFLSAGKVKHKSVPYNDRHGQFYETMNKGGERKEVEKRCVTCHGIQSTPLSKAHPPKEQCLLCHKLSQFKE